LTSLGLLVLAAPATANAQDGVTFYGPDERVAFAEALDERDLAIGASENFEDARPTSGLLGLPLLGGPPTGPMDDPLDADTNNGFFRPGQIPDSLAFQSNRDNEGGTGGPDPVGASGLAIGRPSSQGTHESPTTISSPFTQDGPVSTDVISVDADHEAYALDVSLVRFSFVQPGTDPVGGPLLVSAYDEAGAPIGSQSIDQDDIGPFVGVLAPEGREIGRINISEPGGSELFHGVAAYDTQGGGEPAGPAPADPVGDLLRDLLGALG